MGLSGPENIVNDHKIVCPDEYTYLLMGHAAEMTGPSVGELHEKFSEYLVPDVRVPETAQARIENPRCIGAHRTDQAQVDAPEAHPEPATCAARYASRD